MLSEPNRIIITYMTIIPFLTNIYYLNLIHMKIIITYSAIIVMLVLSACNDRITDPKIKKNDPDSILVDMVGQENRFEIATWNIENFPVQGYTTVNVLSQLIQNLDIDLIAVQEIASIRSFDSLLAKLPGWQGHYSPDDYDNGTYQKTGFIYKSSFISLSSVGALYINERTGYGDWAFPRPPFTAFVQIKDKTGIVFDFNLIVLHMKAYDSTEEIAQRKLACQLLHNYINDEISKDADADFIVLGDWNDQLEDTKSTNVFLSFLNDSLNYLFLTKNITDQESYIFEPYQNLIDHILITKDCRQEYGNGLTSVLYLDEEYKEYSNIISDHRPVCAVFNGIELDLSF